MKNRSIVLILFSLVFGMNQVIAQGNEFDIPLSEPGKKGKLIVDLRSGPVIVKGTNRQDVLVRYKDLEGEDLKIVNAKNGLKKISGGVAGLEISERNNIVLVESDNWNKSVEVYVEVPRSFDLRLETYNDGYIKVENIEGEVDTENYNGPISADNISGVLVASTYNGDIKVTFDQLTPNTPLAYSTYNGDIDITFPAGTKANFKLKSENGDIYTGFDMSFSKPEQPRQVKKGRKIFVDGWIKGKINGGGPEVIMKNYHGDIFIRKN